MNKEEILNKYTDLIDKGYCSDCNELNCIDNFPNAKIAHAIRELQQENKILRENAENNDKVVDNVNWENMLLKKENEQLKDLIDTILNFSFFKEECPLNFSFEDNSKEDKAQDVFYEDEYCENACNDDYRKCWLKYFEKMQELERGGINE